MSTAAENNKATTVTEEPEKLDLSSFDIPAGRHSEILALFPEACTEGGKIDFDRLKLALGETVDVGKERYGLNWPGKADCFRTIQTPSVGTLRPAPEEGINFDTSENVIIEGNNLEVLKLLQKSYLGKIKMIYIDPPYNTGSDFIYPDNYTDTLQTYLEYTGQADSEGKKFGTNTDADGRFHSKWLNMMYPRLYLARNLLREDGVIFISIDENEFDNLRKICNEVFGESNHIEDLVWAQNTTHSQSPLYSTNHEYVMVFARNADVLTAPDSPDVFREPKPGYKEVENLIQSLNPEFPSTAVVEKKLTDLYAKAKADYMAQLKDMGQELNEETEKQDPWRGIYAYKWAEYRDKEGNLVAEKDARSLAARLVIWTSSDASAPSSKQSPTTKDPSHPNFRFYHPVHPKTGKPCPYPKRGWGCPKSWPDSTRESFDQLVSQHYIVWGEDETTIPRSKTFLHDVDTNVAKSFFYDYTDGEKQVAELMERPALFPNPKPTTLVSRLISQACRGNDLVLDFFAGSGTTAQAIFETNMSSYLSCRFILVQLPEPLDPTDSKQKPAADFCHEIGKPANIAEITKERVRRAIKKLDKGNGSGAQLPLHPGHNDFGFKVFRLAESNFVPWTPDSANGPTALGTQLELHINHVKQDRSFDDILYELLLKSGFPLTTPVEKKTVEGKTIYSAASGALVICLDRALTLELIRAIADMKPERVVCLDEGFAGNDQLKTNAVQTFKTKGITSFKTV